MSKVQHVIIILAWAAVLILVAYSGGLFAESQQLAPDATVEFSGPPTLLTRTTNPVGTGNVLFTRSGVNPYLHNSVKIGTITMKKDGCVPTGGKNGTTCEEQIDVWEVLPIAPLGR